MASGDRVGNVYLDVLPRGDQFNAGVQALINKAEKDSKFAVNADTNPAKKAVEDLGQSINQNVTQNLVGAAVQAAAFTAAIYTIKATVTGIVDKFGDLFDVIAKARAGFNSILGNPQEGEALLQQIRQFAIASPFATDQLVGYSQQLLGVGKAANTIVPTLQAVGDIVASVGGDTNNLGSILYALTQIQTIGRLTGQDARQLQNQLVPITKYIADYTKQSVADVKKLQESSGISSDIVFNAILNQGEKVKGALNQSVRTISGAKNVIGDTLKNLFQSNAGFQTIFDDIVKFIQSIDTALSKPQIFNTIESALTAITNVYKELKPAIAGIIEFSKNAGLTGLTAIADIFGVIGDVIRIFPTGALKLIGEAIAALALAKAPLILIKYAETLKTVGLGLIGFRGGALGAAAALKIQAGAATEVAAVTQAQATTTLEAETASKGFTSAIGLQGIAEKDLIAVNEALALSLQQVTAAQLEAARAAEISGRAAAAAPSSAIGPGIGSRVASALTSPRAVALGGIGLAVGGQLLNSNTAKTNVAAQTAGTAAEYAGFGTLIEPGLGTAAGAALGAVVGYINSSEEKMKQHIANSAKLGTDAANAYLQTNEKLFATATAFSTTTLDNQLRALAVQKNKLDSEIASTNKNVDTGNVVSRAIDKITFTPEDPAVKQLHDDQATLAGINAQLTVIQSKYATLVQPIHDATKALSEAGQGADFTTGAAPGEIGTKSLEQLSVAFQRYGLTLQDVVDKGAPAVVQIVTEINSLTDAQKAATVAANNYAAALKSAGTDSTTIYGAQITNATAKISELNAVQQATTSALAISAPNQTAAQRAIAKATYDKDLVEAQSAVRTKAYADSQIQSTKQISDAVKAGNFTLAQQITATQDQTATDYANAQVQSTLNGILLAQNTALTENVRLRNIQNEEAARAKVGTDLQAASDAYDKLLAANKAFAAAGTSPYNQAVQNASQTALFAAQEAAANTAAAKASAVDRQQLLFFDAINVSSDDAARKTLNTKIAVEEETAKQTARQTVLNSVIKDGTAGLIANIQAMDLSNAALKRTITLTELQNRSSALSSTTSAVSAQVSSTRRPGDELLATAAKIATIQAQTAAGDQAAYLASQNLVAQRQELLNKGETAESQDVIALTSQINLVEAEARTVASAKELAEIESKSAIARQGYNYQTSLFLERLQKAQELTGVIYGDEIAKAQAVQAFSSAVSSATQSAVDFATAATSSAAVKGDIFTTISNYAGQAAVSLAAFTAAENAKNAALAYGAGQVLASTQALEAYNNVIEIAAINIGDISTKVEGMNKNLASPEGITAIQSTIQRDIALAQQAKAAADAQISAIQGSGNGFPSADETAKLAKASAESVKQQHIIDILAGRSKDDLGIFSSISAGAQALIQPQLDAAAAQKAKEAADALAAWQDKIVNATNSLTDKLKSAADDIASAAQKWVSSIKERTQYESAVSTTRLTRNAGQQAKDLTELTSGLANLRSRGVSDSVINSLGIGSVADTRQVRKLVRSSDSDLAALTSAVSSRDALATTLATSEDQKKQHDVIVSAIIDAAKSLGVESNFNPAQAESLASTIKIDVNMDPAAIAAAFIAQLSSAKIG